MGMDVYGTHPTSETGEYFRANVWWWRPIAEISRAFAPEICQACQYWHTNDGDGLDARAARELADRLQGAIDDGRMREYLDTREAVLAKLPDERCAICEGTGVRRDEIGVQQGWPTTVITAENVGERFANNPAAHPRFGRTGSCNGCDGVGSTEHWDRSYSADLETTQEWIAFLRDCGGFVNLVTKACPSQPGESGLPLAQAHARQEALSRIVGAPTLLKSVGRRAILPLGPRVMASLKSGAGVG
jgi:hypothetical protein